MSPNNIGNLIIFSTVAIGMLCVLGLVTFLYFTDQKRKPNWKPDKPVYQFKEVGEWRYIVQLNEEDHYKFAIFPNDYHSSEIWFYYVLQTSLKSTVAIWRIKSLHKNQEFKTSI
jgi:hypothetical protein